MDKLTQCKTCGAQIAESAPMCPSCGAPNKKPRKRIGLAVFLGVIGFFVFVGILGSAVGNNGGGSRQPQTVDNAVVAATVAPQKNSAFSGDCGITAAGNLASNIIGYPELSMSIQNTSGKDIAAIRFYAVPYDVYGDEIKGWTTQCNLYTDTMIPAGKSNQTSWQFIEDSIKTVKVYVYSVYYTDGTEWGNKDAGKSVILKEGRLIQVDCEQ